MTADGRRVAGFFIAVACLGGGALLVGSHLLGFAAGPEAEVITALKQTEQGGLTLKVQGASSPLVGKGHRFDRFTVNVDPATRQAVALTTLDFTGTFGETQVSSLGVERIRFEHRRFSWTPVEGFAPRLSAICAALERRRRGLEEGDLGLLASLTANQSEAEVLADPALRQVLAVTARRYRALAWYVRSERDEVLISEEYRLSGSLPERPVDEQGTRRLVLTRSGGEFSFSEGLM